MTLQRAKKSWVIVMLWATVGLTHTGTARGQIGACCRGDGVCIATDSAGCTALPGEFLGDGTVCAPDICVGACCTANKGCLEDNQDNCTDASGSYQGAGSTCELNCPSHLATAFTYQGQLKEGGVPVSDAVDLECSLWTAAVGGTQLAVQTLSNIEVVNGLFTVELNFGDSAFAGNTRWLAIAVRRPHDATNTLRFTTLPQRLMLTATPYAMRALSAADAAQLGGQPPAFYRNASNLDSGTLEVGRLPVPLTLSGTNTVQIISGLNTSTTSGAAGILGLSTASTGGTYGIGGLSYSTSGTGVYGSANAGSGTTYGVYGQSASTSGRGVSGSTTSASGTTYGVYGQSASTSGRGVYGTATAASGTTYGVYGLNNSTDGRGVFGEATAATGAAYGVLGQCASTLGAGVRGWESAVSGTTNGVWGESASTSGRGVYGLATAASGSTYGGRFESASTSGRGVLGLAADGGSGTTYGVYGQSLSTSGRGVFGEATAATGSTYGGYFRTASSNGIGVFGEAANALGTGTGVWGQAAGTSGSGVFGWASAANGTTYGVSGQSASIQGTAVFGRATATTGTNYGGYFISDSTSGRGVYGLTYATSGQSYGGQFESKSTGGRGVVGSATATVGTTYGGYFESASTDGTGVFGKGREFGVYAESEYAVGVFGTVSSATGVTKGVQGYSASAAGTGVFGYAGATSGNTYGLYGFSRSTAGCGVYGAATADSGTTFGVRGECNSPDGYAGYFVGRGFFGGDVAIGSFQGGTGTSAVDGFARQLTLGGEFNAGSNAGNSVKFYIGEFDNDNDPDSPIYPIYVEDENNNVQLALKRSSAEQSTLIRGSDNDGTIAALMVESGAYRMLIDSNEIDSSANLYLNHNSNTNVVIANGGGDVIIANGGGDVIIASSSTDVGIGTVSPTYPLEVEGYHRAILGHATSPGCNPACNITHAVTGICDNPAGWDFYADGAGNNYGSPSSIRWKRNIGDIECPLEKLAQLRGVYFDWDAEHGGQHDVGMIGEEVGAVLPEIVVYEENGIDVNGMDYSKMTPLLVEAVNELHAKFKEKDTEIAELRARLDKFEALVGELTPKAQAIPVKVENQSVEKGTN